MDNELAAQILRNIEIGGSSETTIKLMIGGNMNHIISLSSGKPRFQSSIVKKFSLILSKPANLSVLNSFEIRCCLCHKVISYPAWYYKVEYAVNHFHYFVCFDKDSPAKPSTKCYRRTV